MEKEFTWHYNLMRHKNKHGNFLAVHEVYVDRNPGEEDGISWTKDPVMIFGETPEEVAETLDMIKKDVLKHKIVDFE